MNREEFSGMDSNCQFYLLKKYYKWCKRNKLKRSPESFDRYLKFFRIAKPE